MPVSILPKNNRRWFLQTSAGAAALLSFGAPGTKGAVRKPGDVVRWGLLSDTHIPKDVTNEYRGFRPYENLKNLVPQLLEADPEGLIITGDLARLEGFPGDYANLKKLLQPLSDTMPVCMGLGNHDERKNFTEAFPEHPVKQQTVRGKHVLVIERPPVRFIVLDSLLFSNRVSGLLGKAQREWLQDFLLNTDDTPTFLFFHHPTTDEDGDLLDSEKLFRIIKPRKSVKGVFFGHSHEYQRSIVSGIHVVSLPATGYNFNDNEPIGWIEASFTRTGATLKLHAIGGNTRNDGEVTSLQWRV